jgi:GxxExxY protein
MHGNQAELNRISKVIIGCAPAVANKLGSGFLEKVYENALAYEWTCPGIVESWELAFSLSELPAYRPPG